jgi:hypothetical protein
MAVLGLIALAVFIVLLVAAFSSTVPSFQDSLPKDSAALLANGTPLQQVVATQGDLSIQLPISQRDVTALGYHGSDGNALALKPIGRQANENVFARMVHWLFGSGGHGITYYELGGGVGPGTAALDVGAAEGTDVFSPVDGVVRSIGDYVLNGKAYASTLEIQPTKLPSVVVVVSRLRVDPALTVGAPVTASTTKIGTVIDLSAVERQALAKVTGDAGNHVTIEVDPAASLPVR